MKQYKGIIFDLDGTLLNTIDDLADSVNEVLEKMGYPVHKPEEYKQKVGNGFRNLVLSSLPDQVSEQEVDRGLMLFDEAYERLYMNKTRAYDGTFHLIQELQKCQIPMAINSNKRTDYTQKLVEKNFPGIEFTAVFGEREGIPKKPDPTAAKEICGLMHLKPEEMIYIGDSNTDIMTGKNAGISTIGVEWGFRGRKELESYGADYIVENPQEIFEIIMNQR